MSETDREDKTEDASPERLEQMAKEGNVPMGREMVSFVGFAMGILGLSALGPLTMTSLVGAVKRSMDLSGTKAPLMSGVDLAAADVLIPIFAVTFLTAAGGAAATMAQTQARTWPEKLAPDPKRLFSLEKLTKPFTREFVTDFFLSIVKVVAMSGAALLAVGEDTSTLFRLILSPPEGHIFVLGGIATRAAMGAGAAVFGLAIIDLFLQRSRFLEKAKMSKEEVKRERKEAEGDPLIRRQRKQKHRELSRSRLEEAVPKADAIIVNPTHIAIAIRYRREEGRSPKVIFKGKGDKAERIRELAREHGISIVQDIPLARLLYRKVPVGGVIPEETYRAVAAILSFVYRTKRRRHGGSR